MVLCPYWANIRRWISTGLLLLPKQTALRHVVLRWCNLANERPCFRPRWCHSTEDRALYCTWLNSSTGIVNTAQCTSSSLSRLPGNLKIAFTFWFTLENATGAGIHPLLYVKDWTTGKYWFVSRKVKVIFFLFSKTSELALLPPSRQYRGRR